MASTYPEYVTDGHHVYLWHEEYASMFEQGKLKACDAPAPVVESVLTKEEQQEVEALRQKALKDAELAIKMYGKPASVKVVKDDATKMEEIFGKE
jgi:hypothetical protein